MRFASTSVWFVSLVWAVGQLAAAQPSLSTPVPANARVAALQVRVAPDRPGWTYQAGESVKFRVTVIADQQPLGGVAIAYRVGPEMMPVEEKTAVVPADGLTIDG